MTHYPVFVFAPDEKTAEALLAPFEEYGVRHQKTVHTVLQDCTDEVMKGWNEDTVRRVVLSDGTLVSAFDERFKNPEAVGFSTKPEFIVPPELEQRTVSVKDVMTLDEYAEDYWGYMRHPENPAKWGHWHNPKGYWDWYELGGRWAGHFTNGLGDVFTLKGTPGEQGKDGLPKWNGNIPQAVVTQDGEWHARGEVGWFGYWGGEEKQDEWAAQVKAALEQHHEKYLYGRVYVFDLHK